MDTREFFVFHCKPYSETLPETLKILAESRKEAETYLKNKYPGLEIINSK